MRRTLIVSCLVLAAASSPPGFAAAAVAPLNYETVSRKVSFADLDLTRSQGVATLYSRIRSAASWVCDTPEFRSLDSMSRVSRCKQKAVAQAVEDIHSPELTTLHLATTVHVATAGEAGGPFRR